MKPFMKLLSLGVINILCFVFSCQAQSREDAAYREQSSKIRTEVWNWDKPEFKDRNVPAAYNSYSKVIIAHYTDINASSKSKLKYYGISFATKREQTVSEITRELIKLNDKVAVEEYSSLSFNRLTKETGSFTSNTYKTYIGVRIFKKDNSVKEVDADEIILTKDEKTKKEAKLAIPNLEVGDVIDYFIMTEQELVNTTTERSYNIALFDDAPMLSFSFHGQIGKKYALTYRCYNGAPDLKITRSEDEDVIMDMEKKNIPPFETSLWIAGPKQLPFVRMKIALGSRYGHNWGEAESGDVQKDKPLDEVLIQSGAILGGAIGDKYTIEYGQAMKSKAEYNAKNLNLSLKKMTDVEKADMLFYSLRFYILMLSYNSIKEYIDIGRSSLKNQSKYLTIAFDAADVPSKVLLASPKFSYRTNEVMDGRDLEDAVFLPGVNRVYKLNTVFDIPGAVPEYFDGVAGSRSMEMKVPNPNRYVSPLKLGTPGAGFAIPESKSTDNGQIENLILSVAPDQSNLLVKRKTIAKGYNKLSIQQKLVLYEDMYESERIALGRKTSLIESLNEDKQSRKVVNDLQDAFAEARKVQKENFIADAKDYYEQEITDLENQKVENIGMRHTAPDLVYSSEFKMNGLIKRAGNNLIFEIGKIQGTPLTIKPEQRKRELDIYMAYARSIEYWMEINIPEGYSAQGVEALNKNISNETGFFIAEASSDGKIIHVKVRKHYLHGYEKVENWNKLTAFVDASNEWLNAKILFKKN